VKTDLVQAFLKKWWVESDFKVPNLPLSLRLKVSGCHYNSIYNNTWTKQVKQLSKQHQTQWSKCQRRFLTFQSIKKHNWLRAILTLESYVDVTYLIQWFVQKIFISERLTVMDTDFAEWSKVMTTHQMTL
jgi:hypothetical protein